MNFKKLSLTSGFLTAIGAIFAYFYLPVFYVVSLLILLSIIFFSIYFAGYLSGIKRLAGNRSFRMGADSLIAAVMCMGILVLFDILTARHDIRFDLTSNKKFSLSSKTIALLKDINVKKKDVKVTLFYRDMGSLKREAKDLLDAYKYHYGGITYSFVDPDKDPDIARRFSISDYEISVVESGKRTVKVDKITEGELTAAIIRVTRDKTPEIAFTAGHGEHDIDSEGDGGYKIFRTALEDQGIKVNKINLLTAGGITSDILIIAGPVKPFAEQEMRLLWEYYKNNGRILFLLDPDTEAGLEPLLFEAGIVLRQDEVYDTASRPFGGSPQILVIQTYIEHEITNGFTYSTLFPFARSIRFNNNKKEEIKYSPILLTGEESWARIDSGLPSLEFNPDTDKKGPVIIGAALTPYTPPINKEASRIVAIGDSDFAGNLYFKSQGNAELMLNIIDWLSGKEVIAMTPVDELKTTLILDAKQAKLFFYVLVVIIPLTIGIIGVIIFLRRRRL